MRLMISAVVFAAATAVASPSLAQGTGSSSSTRPPSSSQAKPAKPKVPRPPLEYRAFFLVDASMMAASQSFKAVAGSSTMFGYGAGGEIHNLWKKLFMRVAFASASREGERVFINGTDVIPSGFPVDLGIRTVELGGGWRMPLTNRPVALYAGGGLLFTKYTETNSSAVALPEDDVAMSVTGYSVQGGLDMKMGKRFTVGVEAQYRIVPDALGGNGVSALFAEDNLNAFVIRGMVGVRFGKN